MSSGTPATVQTILLVARGGVLDGAERQLFYLAAHLDRAFFTPIVVLDRDGSFADELRAHEIETHILPLRPWRTLRGFLFRRSDAARLADLAASRKVRVIHASDLWKSAYALAVAERLNIPSIIHIRGPITPRDVRKHRIGSADAVVPIAERYIAELTRAGIPSERIHPIDDAVDDVRFIPDHPGREGFRMEHGVGNRIAVGIIGRIEPFKRVVEFLEIVAQLQRQAAAGAVFLVIGEPGPDDYMRKVHHTINRLGLRDRIIFTGRRDDMPAVIGGLDVLMTLSGGSVMFEAMAAAKAVLSIRTERRHSVHVRHNETGYCVTTTSFPCAARALQRLIENERLRHRLGIAARRQAQDHLSPTLLAERTQSLYSRLLGVPASTPVLSA